jgi:hypothetical protein
MPATTYAHHDVLAHRRNSAMHSQLVTPSLMQAADGELHSTFVFATVSLQAAKSLGQTLRAFQPTIREVVEVSQEIKGTLEQVRLLSGSVTYYLLCLFDVHPITSFWF